MDQPQLQQLTPSLSAPNSESPEVPLQVSEPVKAPEEPQPKIEKSSTDEFLEKKKKRAERFGLPFKETSSFQITDDQQLQSSLPPPNRKKYIYLGGGFGTGIDFLSEEEKKKRSDRSQRFAQATNPESQDSKDSEKEKEKEQEKEPETQTEPIEFDFAEPRREAANTEQRKWDTLHVYGTDGFSTEQLFDFFQEYSPSELEWLNDSSCNILFPDKSTAFRALFAFGNPETCPTDQNSNIPPQDRNYDNETLQGWWKCLRTNKPNYRLLQIRIATEDDKKPLIPKPSRYYALLEQSQPSEPEPRRNRRRSHQNHDDDRPRGDRRRSYPNNDHRDPVTNRSKRNMFNKRNESNYQRQSERKHSTVEERRRKRFNEPTESFADPSDETQTLESNRSRRWKRDHDEENDENDETEDIEVEDLHHRNQRGASDDVKDHTPSNSQIQGSDQSTLNNQNPPTLNNDQSMEMNESVDVMD